MTSDGLSALGLAVACGQLGALCVLLEHDHVDPSTSDRDGQTLLHIAAKRIAALCASRDATQAASNGNNNTISDSGNPILGCVQTILERLRVKLCSQPLLFSRWLDQLDASEGLAVLHIAQRYPSSISSPYASSVSYCPMAPAQM